MSVVVLMYHHTPADAAQGFYDVPLATLRAQVEALREAGADFIDFSECGRRDYVEHGLHVALTFDDGHASNEAAFRFLADAGVTPTAFMVRDWSQQDGRYLSAAALGDLKGVVATRRPRRDASGADRRPPANSPTNSPPAAIMSETLRASRRATMALPGGHGGARELAAAARCGLFAGRQFVGAAASPARRQRQPALRPQRPRRAGAAALGRGQRVALVAGERAPRRRRARGGG